MGTETGPSKDNLTSSADDHLRVVRHSRYQALLAELSENFFRFDFFGLLRLIEALTPEFSRLGQATRPVNEPIRLSQDPELAFPAATFSSFTPATSEKSARLATFALGVFGPNGPLPYHLTEHARSRRIHANDPTFIRFMDIFHHRILSLFFRAHANSEPVISSDRPKEDRFAYYLDALMGFAPQCFQFKDTFHPTARRQYVGLLSQHCRNADGLLRVLSDFFKHPIQIHEFVGEWLPIPATDKWKLSSISSQFRLGTSCILGSKSWQRQTKFRIVVGPLSEIDYATFLPNGANTPLLRDIVRTYTGDDLAWELQLIPDQKQHSPLMLGNTSRLGWTSWLGSSGKQKNKEDFIYSPMG